MYHTNLDTSAAEWSPMDGRGISMKMLYRDAASGAMTAMTRMAAGSELPAHRHTAADQTVFVLEGDLIDAGATYGPGTFLVAKAGSPHGPHTTAGGCVLLTTYSATPDFVAVE